MYSVIVSYLIFVGALVLEFLAPPPRSNFNHIRDPLEGVQRHILKFSTSSLFGNKTHLVNSTKNTDGHLRILEKIDITSRIDVSNWWRSDKLIGQKVGSDN